MLTNLLCIHIQTHKPHFKYTNNLINSFIEKTNIKELNIPIYIVCDDEESINIYKDIYNYDYENINFLNLTDIINLSLYTDIIKETFDTLYEEVININWGAGGHRNYVAIKRTYSILELYNIGYQYIWCLDSESLILKNIDLTEIINKNISKPKLVVGINNNGVKYPQIINNLFQFEDYDKKYKHISVRMNDFWFIHGEHFYEMIKLLSNIHNKPISYFINGSEQSVYEYYIYNLYLDDNEAVDLIQINGDLHNNNLFRYVINNNINIDDFCNDININYFNHVYSYRGDYYNICMNNDKGRELMDKLNIYIAVSNYQGL